MHHVVEIVEVGRTLREKGYRLTPQRLMILEAVTAKENHVTAEEIHWKVVEQYPDISLSTVYRTLETLRDLAVVTETDLGQGKVAYHFVERSHHHHLVCRACGKVAELDDAFFGPVAEALFDQYGFKAEMSHFAIFGRCSECSARNRDL